MKLYLKFLVLSVLVSSNLLHAVEFVVISGGPALRKWEKSRNPTHDVFWGNFVNSADSRFQQIKQQSTSSDLLTWLVYRPAYERRSNEEGQNLCSVV